MSATGQLPNDSVGPSRPRPIRANAAHEFLLSPHNAYPGNHGADPRPRPEARSMMALSEREQQVLRDLESQLQIGRAHV